MATWYTKTKNCWLGAIVGIISLAANAQNVGIGTTTPGSRLEVRGTTNDNTASVLNLTSNSGTSRFFVRNDGRVGINETSTLDRGMLTITSNLTNGISGWNRNIYFNNTNHSSITTNELLFGMHDANKAFYFGDITGTTLNKYVMSILANTGRVGINTVTPSQLFHVYTNTDMYAAAIGDHENSHLRIAGTAGGATGYSLLQTFTNASTAGGNLILQRDAGNVGIGTASPLAQLHATSTIRSGAAGVGYSMLYPGTTNRAGYVQVHDPIGGAVGYMGWFTDRLYFHSLPGVHEFNGGIRVGGTASTYQWPGQIGLRGTDPYISWHNADAAGTRLGYIQITGTSTDAGGMILGSGSLRATALSGSGNRVLIADAAGNINAVPYSTVGDHLGNHTATTTLDMNSQNIARVGRTITAINAAGTPETFLHPRWTDNVTYLNFGAAGFNIRNNAGVSRMFITDAGNVGIGNTAPGVRLDVSGNTWVRGNSANATFTNGGHLALKATANPFISWHHDDGTRIGYLQFTGTATNGPAIMGAASLRVLGYAGTGNRVMLAAADGTMSPLPAGTTTQFLRGDGTWQPVPGDNLGNHTATSYLLMDYQWIRFRGSTGLYNSDYGQYFYTTNNNNYWISRSGYGMLFQNASSATMGYVYHDGTNFGLLDAGGAWTVRTNTGVVAIHKNMQVNGNVSITGTMNSTGYKETSDARWKKNVSPIANALGKVMAMRGVNYDFKTKEELLADKQDTTYQFSDRRQIGFIAQEVEKVLPEVVSTDPVGYKTVEYSKVVALLVEAMKEQQKQIETLKAENASLKAQVDKIKAIEARITSIESIFGERMVSMEEKTGSTAEPKKK